MLPAGFLTSSWTWLFPPPLSHFLPPALALLFHLHEFAQQNCPHLSCEAGKSTPRVSNLGLSELETAARPRTVLGYYGYGVRMFSWIRRVHIFTLPRSADIHAVNGFKLFYAIFTLLNSISITERWRGDQIVLTSRRGIGMMYEHRQQAMKSTISCGSVILACQRQKRQSSTRVRTWSSPHLSRKRRDHSQSWICWLTPSQ